MKVTSAAQCNNNINNKVHKHSKTQIASSGSSMLLVAVVLPMRQQVTPTFLMNEALSREPIFNPKVQKSSKPHEASFGHQQLFCLLWSMFGVVHSTRSPSSAVTP